MNSRSCRRSLFLLGLSAILSHLKLCAKHKHDKTPFYAARSSIQITQLFQGQMSGSVRPDFPPLPLSPIAMASFHSRSCRASIRCASSAEGFSETTETVNLMATLNQSKSSCAVGAFKRDRHHHRHAAYGVNSINSATKTLTPLRDIPQSISVVTKEQIRDQSMSSMSDVVAYVPGITSHQGENNRDQLVIRGNSTSADFFLNGVRDDVQYYRDLYNVERVEALKGPNSMIFGRGGGGGVINRVTKEAGFTSLREITLQGGSFGNKRFTADFDQPLGDKVAFRLERHLRKLRQLPRLRRPRALWR